MFIDLQFDGAEQLAPLALPAPTKRRGEAPNAEDGTASESRLGFMSPRRVLVETRPGQVGRRRHSLPAISLGNGLMSRYHAEKVYGKRRENGSLKLKYLGRRHYEVIARHLAGQSGEQIHIFMGLSISTISRILNDPLSQSLIKRTYKDRQSELDALAGEAIGAVRTAFEKGSTSEKLAAVDKFTKLKMSIAPESNPMETAEDFARAIVHNAQNVQINIGGVS